ncbi:MAG: hypothetical protein KGY78_09550 [Anaerolineae bacterium]|nr:hypothetical protein [Anaerolineae bacterium]
MSKVQVDLPVHIWQELVSLGRQEAASPDQLLERAVRDFLEDRRRQRAGLEALQESFGIWGNRDDLEADSSTLVEEWRQEWDERERRIGLP